MQTPESLDNENSLFEDEGFHPIIIRVKSRPPASREELAELYKPFFATRIKEGIFETFIKFDDKIVDILATLSQSDKPFFGIPVVRKLLDRAAEIKHMRDFEASQSHLYDPFSD